MAYQLPLIAIVSALLVASIATVFFIAKQLSNEPHKKAEADKALLKELLEGFGLEVPSELQDEKAAVVKSIKLP